jgi:hypothetical protein
VNRESLFNAWAPLHGEWSPWAKPALFAHIESVCPDLAKTLHAYSAELGCIENSPWVPPTSSRTAIILDLPDDRSVSLALALSDRGYRPIPLFNCAPHPNAVIDLDSLKVSIFHGAELLQKLSLPPDAPPCFMLDSRRMSVHRPMPGQFDNRWMVFPQDFPSHNLLMSRGYRTAVVVQIADDHPQRDLSHVLLRWQQGGMRIEIASLSTSDRKPVTLRKPPLYRSIFYYLYALSTLRRNYSGGFGAIVPNPSSG